MDLTAAYRMTGQAAAAAAEVEAELSVTPDPRAGAFFDIDNTVMRGASLFYLARGLAERRLLQPSQVADFTRRQMRFVLSGSENLTDMASVIESALAFVKGRRVDDVVAFGEQVFQERMVENLWPGTLALAQGHLDAGQRVWLVSATPVELATIIAESLGLTGALGTVSEVRDGVYTGHLVGLPLHGRAKAEAVRALAAREGLELERCSAYSDSSNDIPMLSLVGHPHAINPDRKLAAHARTVGWPIQDYRRRRHVGRVGKPLAVGASVTASVAGVAALLRRGKNT